MRWPWVRRFLLDVEMEYSRSLAQQLADADRERADALAERDIVEMARQDLAAQLAAERTGRENALRRAAAAGTRADLLQAKVTRLERERDQHARAAALLDDRLAVVEGRPVQGVA